MKSLKFVPYSIIERTTNAMLLATNKLQTLIAHTGQILKRYVDTTLGLY